MLFIGVELGGHMLEIKLSPIDLLSSIVGEEFGRSDNNQSMIRANIKQRLERVQAQFPFDIERDINLALIISKDTDMSKIN
jgi:hypothetical protein